MNYSILEAWLLNEQDPGFGGGPEALAGVPSDSQQPFLPGAGAKMPPAEDTNVSNLNDKIIGSSPEEKETNPADKPNASSEPASPDMPEEAKDFDYDTWESDYFKETMKADTNKLIAMIQKIRDYDLDPYRKKFVEDNLQVCFLRQQANIEKVSNEIRKNIKEELDQNNPSVSLTNHIINNIQRSPDVANIFIKLIGFHGMKGDLHRKFLASLLMAVQVGSGGLNEDLIFNQKDYSIKISTRMNSKFGSIDLGRWFMTADEPEKYLSESELERMEDGAPEEKDVLRKRIIIDSISSFFKKRAFLVNVVGEDGTIYLLGMDLSTALKSAYNKGKLIVQFFESANSEAIIDKENNLIPVSDIKIMYQKDLGQLDESGKPIKENVEFISRRDGVLFLIASEEIIKEAAFSFTGINIKSIPYNGNPSDLKVLQRCIPSAPEMLLRNC
jgi:hypothetical protein